jgi:hypothetical protein
MTRLGSQRHLHPHREAATAAKAQRAASIAHCDARLWYADLHPAQDQCRGSK